MYPIDASRTNSILGRDSCATIGRFRRFRASSREIPAIAGSFGRNPGRHAGAMERKRPSTTQPIGASAFPMTWGRSAWNPCRIPRPFRGNDKISSPTSRWIEGWIPFSAGGFTSTSGDGNSVHIDVKHCPMQFDVYRIRPTASANEARRAVERESSFRPTPIIRIIDAVRALQAGPSGAFGNACLLVALATRCRPNGSRLSLLQLACNASLRAGPDSPTTGSSRMNGIPWRSPPEDRLPLTSFRPDGEALMSSVLRAMSSVASHSPPLTFEKAIPAPVP